MTVERFAVAYRIFAASADEASERAAGIALEQTVEIPRDVVPAGYIEDTILGKVEEVSEDGADSYQAWISYSPDSCGSELGQLFNIIFGNSSIIKDIKVVGFKPGATITQRFPGARYGIAGIRQLCGRKTGGLISPVLKPQGSSAAELARIAKDCALAGADLIKDDHGLTDQSMATFKERVKIIGGAVAEANAQTGGATLYFPNLAGHRQDLEEYAHFAQQTGADGVLVLPGLYGFDLIHRLATDAELGLPVMAHPSFLGPYVLSPNTGFSHGMMFGTLQRLAGADISVFPNVGGRFGFSALECTEIATACREQTGHGAQIIPSPGGGMSVAHAKNMVEMYGEDVAFLLGGSLLRHGDRIGEVIKQMREAVDAAT